MLFTCNFVLAEAKDSQHFAKQHPNLRTMQILHDSFSFEIMLCSISMPFLIPFPLRTAKDQILFQLSE